MGRLSEDLVDVSLHIMISKLNSIVEDTQVFLEGNRNYEHCPSQR